MNLVRTQQMPPYTLKVYYQRRNHCFRIEVWHDDGRIGVDYVAATYVPVFGIDVSDNEEISIKAEQICRHMEKESS
jgi:hypothetical protein